MAYISPGVYIKEKQIGGQAVGTGLIIPCVIGKGIKIKRHWDKLITRGQVNEEIIVPDVNGIVSLVFNSNERRSTSRLKKGTQSLPSNSYSFVSNNQIIIDLAYRDINANWTFTYIATNKDVDIIGEIDKLLYVSKSPGGITQFILGEDFNTVVNGIDWSIPTPATAIGTNIGNFDLSVNNNIKISIDGKAPQEINVAGIINTATTPIEIADAINIVLNTVYGTSYGGVAAVIDNKVKLTSVQQGISGTINFYIPTTSDATNIIFGINPPAYYSGQGRVLAVGETYFVRYDTIRPDIDYDNVSLFFQFSDAMNQLGPMTIDNELLIAVEMAFRNGAHMVCSIQVNDIDKDGLFMDLDWMRALDTVKDSSIITELVLLNDKNSIIAHAINIISSGTVNNHWMAGYFGAKTGTMIGDPDTIETIVYKSTQVAQVQGEDPARGRFLFMGVPDFKYQVFLTDSNEIIELNLNGYMLGAAVAGYQAGIELVSDSMLRARLTGITPSSILTTLTEARFMASFGVFVVTNVGGKVTIFDPVTTDQGGDPIFIEPNIRLQKDHLAKRIKNRLELHAIGAVPDDPDDFINEIKTQIGLEIEVAIVDRIIDPFRDVDGRVREINFNTDVTVYQSQIKKTEYRFRYWFQAKWVVKRIFGEYIVDSSI